MKRAERVLVVLLDVPRERFEAGLSPDVRQRLQYHDSLWSPPFRCPTDVGGLLKAIGGLPMAGGGPLTLLLDSLSWLMLRLPPPRLGQTIAGLLGGAPKPALLVALVHEDLHPPPVLRALGALASTQLIVGGAPPTPPAPQNPPMGPPRLIRVLTRPRRGGVTHKEETFTLHPDGTLGVPPPITAMEGERGPPPSPPTSGGPPQPITFRLRLSEAERAARAAVPPPYQLSAPRRSMQGVPIDPDPPEDEDPDEDLDV